MLRGTWQHAAAQVICGGAHLVQGRVGFCGHILAVHRLLQLLHSVRRCQTEQRLCQALQLFSDSLGKQVSLAAAPISCCVCVVSSHLCPRQQC